MKNSYIAISIKENNKNYAYIFKHNHCNNLLNILQINNIEFALLCKTKKEAEKIVNNWNQTFKNNKTYMFDTPSF